MKKLLFLLLLSVGILQAQTRVGVTSTFTFEGSTPFAGISTVVGRTTQSTGVIPARAGTAVARVEVVKGDPMIASGARSEMNMDQTALPPPAYDEWFGVSYYIPASWVVETDPALTDILYQEHSDSGNPPFAFGISHTQWYAQAKYINSGNILNLGAVPFGQWVDFVFHTHWSTGTDGFKEIYMNKVLLGKWTGATYITGQSAGPFIKWGDYKWPWNTGAGEQNGVGSNTTDRLLYTDEVRIGNSTSDLNSVSPAATTTNTPPTVSAGSDKTITLPTNSTTGDGSGVAVSPGTSVTYKWTELSGPSTITISNSTSAVATFPSLIAGTYKFVLTVTDNNSLSSKDTMQVIVNPQAPAQVPPTVSAGNDQVIVFNGTNVTATVTETSNANIPATSISGIVWSKYPGTTAGTIVSSTSATTTITGLPVGVYTYQVKVTDNLGGTNTDTVHISVVTSHNACNCIGGTPTRTLRTGRRGPGSDTYVWGNKLKVLDSCKLPTVTTTNTSVQLTGTTGSVTLKGTAVANNGSPITIINWTQVSGPSKVTINNYGSFSPTITNLIAGTYIFDLAVEDSCGFDNDVKATVTVLPIIVVTKTISSASYIYSGILWWKKIVGVKIVYSDKNILTVNNSNIKNFSLNPSTHVLTINLTKGNPLIYK